MIKRFVALVTVGIIAVGGSGLAKKADAEEVSPTLPGVVSVNVLDIVTEEYKQETREMAMDTETPLSEETIQRIKNVYEAWKIKTFGPYEEELRELGAEDEFRIEFGTKMLYAWDNSTWIYSKNPDEKFQNYLSRQEIIDYVLTGENEDVLCDPDGRLLLWQVNMTERMKEGLKGGIEILIKGGEENVYDYFYKSGGCVCFAANLLDSGDRGVATSLLNEWGVVGFNMTEVNMKQISDEDLKEVFARNLNVEFSGIDFFQLNRASLNIYSNSYSAESVGNCELFKDITVGKILSRLEGSNDLNDLGDGLIAQAEKWADKYGLSTESEWTKRQAEIMVEIFDIAGENFLATKN